MKGLASGYTIAAGDWFYDAAVKGADAVTARPGFAAMLERIAGNGVRTIIVESPDRFAAISPCSLQGTTTSRISASPLSLPAPRQV